MYPRYLFWMPTPGNLKRKECYAVQILFCLSPEGEKEPGCSLDLWGWYYLCAAAPALSAAGHRASSGALQHGCYTNNNINKYLAPFLIFHALLQTSEDYAPRHTREYGNHIRISGFI